MLYHGADLSAGVSARYINQHSLEMPNGYRTKNVLYRSQVSHGGILASTPRLQTKKPYLMHSVTPHAIRIPEKAIGPPFLPAMALPIVLVVATICGYAPTTPHTSINRLATCKAVVIGLARTRPRTEWAISRTARVWVKVRRGWRASRRPKSLLCASRAGMRRAALSVMIPHRTRQTPLYARR